MSDEWEVLEEAGFHVTTERTNLPLDEIIGAAGIKNWSPLRAWAEGFAESDENDVRQPKIDKVPWAMDNLSMLTDGAYALSKLQPKVVPLAESYFKNRWHSYDDGRPQSLTAAEMIGPLERRGAHAEDKSLLKKGVIRRRKPGEPYYSRVVLFKTPKDNKVSRLIACGQEANAACAGVEAFEKPRNEEIIMRMRALGKAFYVICDEKNSFFSRRYQKNGDVRWPSALKTRSSS